MTASRVRALALLLILAGLALRLALTFPVHKYVADADSLLTGMRAFQVMRGETPVFFSGVRIGSIEPHAAAAVFFLFGASRTTLALVPILFAAALLLVLYGLYRELFPPGVALTALLLFAVPSPAFLAWTYMPDGYPATLFLCALILWTAALLRRDPGRLHTVLFGIAVGLGWWQSFQTLGMTTAALMWLLWSRPELWRRPRLWAVGLAGFLLGAFPWIAYNVVLPLHSFRDNFAARPATEIGAVASNVHYFFTYSLPEVVTPVREAWTQSLADPAAEVYNGMRLPVLFLYAAAALVFLAVPAVRRRAGVSTWLLFVLVIAAYAGLNIFSEAGQIRGISVRYVLPVYLVVPGMLAVLLSLVAERSRGLAVALAAVVLLFNVTAYHWPGRSTREVWQEEARHDDRLVGWLEGHGVTAVFGGYWTAYPINFLSHERILALPCDSDQYDYRGRRPPGRLYRWALVSVRPEELEKWAARAGVAGSLHLAAPGRAVFVLDRGPADAGAQERMLERLEETCEIPD
ncbi:MAG TPA: glycosyltransferase family 39 protein [Thermoanaerobaculia bacterium]|nr:glycosyltransferase family 39 protein [Thermoanaerobaculia bacterium]